jgi:hypothetical protein
MGVFSDSFVLAGHAQSVLGAALKQPFSPHAASPLKPDVTILARLTPGNEAILDYLCFPTRKIEPCKVTLSSKLGPPRDIQQFSDLAFVQDFANWGRRSRRKN